LLESLFTLIISFAEKWGLFKSYNTYYIASIFLKNKALPSPNSCFLVSLWTHGFLLNSVCYNLITTITLFKNWGKIYIQYNPSGS
jgi:hypothetical protein